MIDWRAPAAAAFYRATPVEPMGVIRRRVLRCKGIGVVGVEDDLDGGRGAARTWSSWATAPSSRR